METLVRIGEFPATLQAQIDREFRCLPVRAVLADDALRRGVRGLITRSNYQVPLAVVDQLPALRVIATSGVGHDGIPVVQALRRGIVMTTRRAGWTRRCASWAVGYC